MDSKKSRHQYRLKGATRILSENCVDEPSKSIQMEHNVDSTTPTSPTRQLNDQSALQIINQQSQQFDQYHTQQNNQQSILFSGSVDPSTSVCNTNSSTSTTITPVPLNHQATSAAYNVRSTSANIPNIQNNNGSQSTSFKSPQILSSEIKSLFECPICFDYATPPIYQCQNGHLVCQGCSSKITHCPTCRVLISKPSIRNLQLDRLANTFQFPCKYNFNGCQWKSYWFKKREHEENCDFISYSCPCPGTACKWTGLLSEVMPHLSEHHKSITTLSGEDIVFLATDINLKGAVDWVMIQSCFNHHFLLVLEKQELKSGHQQFFAVVQLIGSQKEAQQFKYKLELSSGSSGDIRRLQWEARPHSILDGIQAAMSNHDCLVFDARVAKHFLSHIQKDKDNNQANHPTCSDGPGENLGINVTIGRLSNNIIPI